MTEWVVRMKGPADHCSDCRYMVSRDNDDCVLQSDEANERAESWEDLKAGCPFIAVLPEKHGELIDRQAVYKKIKWWQENTHDTVTKAMLYEFYLMLYGVPPIVPATEGGEHDNR